MRLVNHIPDLIAEYETVLGRPVLDIEIAKEAEVSQGTFSRYKNTQTDSTKFEIEFRLCHFFSRKLGRPITRNDLFSFDESYGK